MHFSEAKRGWSRIAVFGIFLMLFLGVSFYALLWPVWDYAEAGFVSRLLKTMPGEADSSGAWYGAKVEGQDTVLVSGPLYAQRAPRNEATDEVYEDCVILRRDIEFLGLDMRWKRIGQTVFSGEEIKIGGWDVDPLLLRSAIIPADVVYRYGWSDRNVLCPSRQTAGKKPYLCRYAEHCITTGDHSILGVIKPASGGNRMVALPNETLLDYPLTQRGYLAPAEFAGPYRQSMIKRIRVYPLFVASCHFALAVLLLSLVNGSLEQGIKNSFRAETFRFEKINLSWFNNHFAFIRVAYGLVIGPLIRQKLPLSSPQWRATIAGLLLPALPLVAYEVISFDSFFILAIVVYAAGLFGFVYFLWRWFKSTLS